MKPKFQKLYMDIAHRVAQMSSAQRLQVGAVIVRDDRILSMGYNGTPSGWDNVCEDKILLDNGTEKLVTKPEVLHAETNALAKLARSTDSGLGASLFCTHAPCIDCAKMIYQTGINQVYFGQRYRNDSGLQFLRAARVDVIELAS